MSNDLHARVPSASRGHPPSAESRLYETAADWNRRFVLAHLEESGPIAEEDLATAIASSEHDKPARLVTDEERGAVLARLRHVHLPKLADAGLIERDGDSVVPTGHRSIAGNDPLADEVESGETLDRLYEALSDSLRRDLLVVLAEQSEAVLTLEEAAAAIGGQRASTDRPDDQVLVSLHHHHLPKLDEAGIVSYDPEEQRIVYEGHPALREHRL